MARRPLGAFNIRKGFRLKKKEREEQILKWAYEYATTGEYLDYVSIEIKLRSEGYYEARTLLDNEFIRNEINELCLKAREKKNEQNH